MADLVHFPSVSFRVKPLVATGLKELLPVMSKPVVEKPKEERDTDMLVRILMPVTDGKAAVTFYKEGFGFHEVRRINKKNRLITSGIVDNLSAELDFGDYVLAIYEGPFKNNPEGIRGFRFLTTSRPDKFVARAVGAGAVLEGKVVRGKMGLVARIKDPFGFVWQICTDVHEPLISGPFLPNKK
ncbi:hypothetical protein FNV43_RR23156 [Rhamnella rubrinervis]|uniref:VOC domain-containing protein n=1 Tax=Rhamnella rubrinervis TaxID=2594499 RepID=A0A8K0DXI7_9ROSA|nr:hypothetical protein FNV43_RR23156 [Rhamnella rubrinervis]